MTIESTVRFVVRFVAAFVLAAHWTYRAGLATGRFVHAAKDWLASASREPGRVAAEAIRWASDALAEPAEPSLAETLGAILLTDEELEAEIAAYDAAAQPSLADAFAQTCAAMAASDARLYRQAGERIANMKAILAEAEAEPAPVKRNARRKPATAPKAEAEA